eukprot:3122295-Amphidinium_carterae.1
MTCVTRGSCEFVQACTAHVEHITRGQLPMRTAILGGIACLPSLPALHRSSRMSPNSRLHDGMDVVDDAADDNIDHGNDDDDPTNCNLRKYICGDGRRVATLGEGRFNRSGHARYVLWQEMNISLHHQQLYRHRISATKYLTAALHRCEVHEFYMIVTGGKMARESWQELVHRGLLTTTEDSLLWPLQLWFQRTIGKHPFVMTKVGISLWAYRSSVVLSHHCSEAEMLMLYPDARTTLVPYRADESVHIIMLRCRQ